MPGDKWTTLYKTAERGRMRGSPPAVHSARDVCAPWCALAGLSHFVAFVVENGRLKYLVNKYLVCSAKMYSYEQLDCPEIWNQAIRGLEEEIPRFGGKGSTVCWIGSLDSRQFYEHNCPSVYNRLKLKHFENQRRSKLQRGQNTSIRQNTNKIPN